MSVTRFMCGIAAFSIGSPAAALAQQTQEPEVVITAPLEGSRIESLQGAEVLRREDIVEQLNGGLGDTLDATPGIATTFFGAGASRPIIRGLGEDRVRVLQNGIGTIDASTVSPDHAVTSDALDAERIEILRGSAALAYGGNAIGGVVNVIDQSIPTRAVDGVDVDALAAYSSVDEGTHGAARAAFGAGALAFQVNGSATDTEPYDTPVGVAPNQYTSARTYGAGGSLLGDWGFAGLAIKQTENEYGLLPHHDDEPAGRIELEQTRIESRGDFRIDVGPFDRLDYGVQTSDYQHTEFEGDGEAGTVFTSEGWEARLEAHHRGERLRGAIGLQVSDVDFGAIGEEAFISDTNTQDTGLFLVERLDFGGGGIEGGIRAERRELDNVDAGSRDFDSLSASIGAFVRPAQNWFLGVTAASTERAPTAVELFSDGLHLATESYEVGDADLTTETALSVEASARYETQRMRFEINLYHINFDDYIALVDTGTLFWVDEDADLEGFDPPDAAPMDAELFSVFAFTQQDAEFTGGEVFGAARIYEAAGIAFSVDAAYDWVRASFTEGGYPPRIPPASFTLGFDAESAYWDGRVELVSVDDQNRLATFETPTDDFTFVNASLAFRPGGEESPWSLRLDGRNLTDATARVHSSFLKDEIALPGRNVRFSVIADF